MGACFHGRPGGRGGVAWLPRALGEACFWGALCAASRFLSTLPAHRPLYQPSPSSNRHPAGPPPATPPPLKASRPRRRRRRRARRQRRRPSDRRRRLPACKPQRKGTTRSRSRGPGTLQSRFLCIRNGGCIRNCAYGTGGAGGSAEPLVCLGKGVTDPDIRAATTQQGPHAATSKTQTARGIIKQGKEGSALHRRNAARQTHAASKAPRTHAAAPRATSAQG